MSVRARRLERVRAAMSELGVDALLLSLGADLPWLSGYEAMPLERLTMLVVPADAPATLVVPRLEAPRVEPDPDVFAIAPFAEGQDPVALVAELVGARRSLAVSDRAWATFVLGLQRALPGTVWSVASAVTGPLRAVKDPAEIEALAAASAAADRVAAALLGGEIRLVGRSEKEVSDDLGRRLVAEGHQKVNFAIVGSGPNSASPHHEPGSRRIEPGEAVVCDFGGTMDGYCSDITRTVWTATTPEADFVELYGVLEAAQAAAVRAAQTGVTCEAVDAAARGPIAEGGYGDAFIHRTGHGIGLEEHEDPYIVAGNTTGLVPGHAFSVEPGIYLDGRFGARIEDIVVAADAGPRPLNTASHALTVVDG
ncbi:Xaa-Pro peptidase family protein [Acidiferrimicrobium sp. IK]|uniref:M24 family metallopeptidase n=1 Tax=Acidiferrimicrobium sp. IK TaxID=2871700 RepID=UPI0021CAE371|nr:Xaa-Pro peptidase family protein [Acidiferrimicrobium sp. IK]MCU4184294.1 Xaa-Pro peptidase family protein [Acidiferrimicrobium sp. IK]